MVQTRIFREATKLKKLTKYRFTKQELDNGICYYCKKPFQKIEWHREAEVVLKSIWNPKLKSWVEHREPEINLPDEDPVIEYHCDTCRLSYHINSEIFEVDR